MSASQRFTSVITHNIMAPSYRIFTLFQVAILLLATASISQPLRTLNPSLPQPETAARPRVEQAFGQLPLYFVENQGQVDQQVAYYIQGSDKTIYFTSEGVTFALTAPATETTVADSPPHKAALRPPTFDPPSKISRWTVKLDFVGANADVRPIGQDKTEAVISYFKGPREQWHAGLPTYGRIVYTNLWPGIDLVYHGTVNRLKYEFVVHPGADPSHIRLAYRGATDVRIDDAGQLEVTTPLGSFIDDTPVAYQEIDGRRVSVSMAYQLSDAGLPMVDSALSSASPKTYGFALGDYDPTHPLVLDPAMLVYCGYIGGSGSDSGEDIAVDGNGNVYITGTTDSFSDFPVVVGPDLSSNYYSPDYSDAFVAKVNAEGTALVYCGYISGALNDAGNGIAVDGDGNAYVIGTTEYSAEDPEAFPVTGGPDLTHNGVVDAFVAKVKADGTGLDYCGYIGGSDYDAGGGIAVDTVGNAYVTGETCSTEATFPVAVGPDLTHNGVMDAFVAKVKADGTGLDYCGYIGGSGDDMGWGIAVNLVGRAYVTGQTTSTQASFPVTVGPDLTHNGGKDAFVAKVKADGTGLHYCGYIGGSGDDIGRGIAAEPMPLVQIYGLSLGGKVYVTGETRSKEDSFPATLGPDLTHNGGLDAFVASVNGEGTALRYCGYIGGSSDDSGQDIAIEWTGGHSKDSAYVTGWTSSTENSFPVRWLGTGLTHNGGRDAFVAEIQFGRLHYCNYVGGAGNDLGQGIAADAAGNAYITGWTASTEASFPVSGGPDVIHNGGSDAFVAKVAVPVCSEEVKGDWDGDGLTNCDEFFGWHNRLGWHQTDPNDADTDNDGIPDGREKLYNTDPWMRVPMYIIEGERNSYNRIFYPSRGPNVSLNHDREQRWEIVAEEPTEDIMRIAIKGTLWGPKECICWDFWSGRCPPAPLECYAGPGIVISLYSSDLRFINDGGSAFEPDPNFHLIVEPFGVVPFLSTPIFVVDVSLTVTWTSPGGDGSLRHGDTAVVANWRREEETVSLGGTLAHKGWGLSFDGEGNFGLVIAGCTLNLKMSDLTTTSPGEHAPFTHDEEEFLWSKQELDYPVVEKREGFLSVTEKTTSIHLNTELDVFSYGPPPPTEELKINVSGEVLWNAMGFQMISYIDETMYIVIQSSNYSSETNQSSLLHTLHSPTAGTRSGGVVRIQQSLGGDPGMTTADDDGDESFKSVTVVPFDSDGDSQPDALTITWDADTTLTQEDVYMAARVYDQAGVTRYLYGPYTVYGGASDPRQVPHYGQAGGGQAIAVGLLDADLDLEDSTVLTATLAAGPGDPGVAAFTTLTPTIAGQSATIAWDVATNLAQEDVSVLILVKGADGFVEGLTFGPHTIEHSGANAGQLVFHAPSDGQYEAQAYLLDAQSKIEDEAVIPLPIGVPASTFTGNYAPAAVDMDGDGQDDTLEIAVEVDLGTSGAYRLEGGLYDSGGELIEQTHRTITGTSGVGQIPLQFDGIAIYRHGAAGPYALKDLQLLDADNIRVAVTTPYTTPAYGLGTFGLPPASLADSYADMPVDKDSDGLYEGLDFQVAVDVSTGGEMLTLRADLYDAEHDYVGSATASQALASGTHTVTLSFAGHEIRAHQTDGPYTLTRLQLIGPSGRPIDWRNQAYMTDAYTGVQFQELAATLNRTYSDVAWDTDSDGQYNYLAVDASVHVAVEGEYFVEGLLVDSQGNGVPWTSSALYALEPGNYWLRIPFDGTNIQSTGSDVFSLVQIRLFDGSGTLLDRHSDAFTTSSYPLDQFEPGGDTAAASVLDDDMESGTSNWIADSPWALTALASHSPSHAWTDSPSGNYADNADTSLTSAPIDLSDVTGASLTFWTRYDLEAGADYGIVEISADNGQNWAILAAFTGVTDDWHEQRLDLAEYRGQQSVRVRFRLLSNESVTADGWYIDDVQIAGAKVNAQYLVYLPIVLK